MSAAAWTLLLMVTGAGVEPAKSTLEATTPVGREQDRCLDHAVKELGMSAKRVENERRWTIGPQFLHPSIAPDGKLSVEMKPGRTALKRTLTSPYSSAALRIISSMPALATQ